MNIPRPIKNIIKRVFLFFSLRMPTRNKIGYINPRQRSSIRFRLIKDKLFSYKGTGPIGPAKYWEYPWAIVNSRLFWRGRLRVLDAGCGKSPVQFLLAELGHDVHGIDPFENVDWHGIDRSLMEKFGLNITYKVEGMENISYPDNTFDRVFCLSVIEHCRAENVAMKDNMLFKEGLVKQTRRDRELQAKMMREMIRVLKPGGLLIITVDFTVPQEEFLLEANVDIKNLLYCAPDTEILGRPKSFNYYGFDDFDLEGVRANPDVEIIYYADLYATSMGFILRKIKD